MKNTVLIVGYDEEKEELRIVNAWYGDDVTPKVYDKIRSAGDIGTAVKDYCMGMEKDE